MNPARHDGGRVRDYAPSTGLVRKEARQPAPKDEEPVKSSKKSDAEVVLPVTVRLPKFAIERLESDAAEQGVTRSEYVRALLVEPPLLKSSKLLPPSRDRTVNIKILSEINKAGRRIESAVRILESAADGGHLDNDTVDRAAVQIASVDSTLREALAHAVKD